MLLLLLLILLILVLGALLSYGTLVGLGALRSFWGSAPLPTATPLPWHELKAKQIQNRLSLVFSLKQHRVHRLLLKQISRQRIGSQQLLNQTDFMIAAPQGLPT